MEHLNNMLCLFFCAAFAIFTDQFDWIQAAGNSQLQERECCGKQPDETGQAGTL